MTDACVPGVALDRLNPESGLGSARKGPSSAASYVHL